MYFLPGNTGFSGGHYHQQQYGKLLMIMRLGKDKLCPA
jgi:hypothetical protein